MSPPRKRAPRQGEKFRLVVSSAEEAVKAIREQYGENARVLSVEQVGGKGLARFLSAPQLEVIGMVVSPEEIERDKAKRAHDADLRREQQPNTELPVPEESPPTPQRPPASPVARRPSPATAQPQSADIPTATPDTPPSARPVRPVRPTRPQATGTPSPTPTARPVRPVRPGTRPAPQPTSAPSTLQAPASAPPPTTPKPVATPPQPDERMREQNAPLTPSGRETLDSLLRKARFDDELIQRIETNTDWQKISKMQLNHGLSEIFYWLRSEYQKMEVRPIATRMAFMGTPGCGKTTALCKRMANDVFVHGKQIQVLKVEGESPNPDDALRVLCDILGVELYRDPFDLDKVDPNGDLYVDVPGVSLNETDHWKALGQRLDELYVETRVLVINAAYEREAIKDMLAVANSIGCTHQVFTHLDELANVTKLWQFILGSKLTTLFFSYGQNVTSEFSNDILEFMTSKTFPSYLTH